jgi:hypothetical protein
MKDKLCPLCNIKRNEEVIFYENDDIIILETKKKKGHKERIMVVWKDHVVDLPDESWHYAMFKLIEIGKKVFSYTPKFVIMEGTFATIKHHWHLVATDLDPNSEDFKQILATPWIDVIGTDMEGIF